MAMFLTSEELQELTGYKRGSDQARWLKTQGYYVETNARGIPRITQKQVDDQRQVAPAAPSSGNVSSEPNVLAFRQKLQSSQ